MKAQPFRHAVWTYSAASFIEKSEQIRNTGRTESLGLLAELAEGSLGDVITVGSTVMACQKSG